MHILEYEKYKTGTIYEKKNSYLHNNYNEFIFFKKDKDYVLNKSPKNPTTSNNIELCVIFDKRFEKKCGKKKIITMPKEIYLITDRKINFKAFN